MEAVWCYIDLVLRSWTEDEIEDLLYFLQKLDDAYLAHRAKGIEKSQNKNSKRGRRRRGK